VVFQANRPFMALLLRNCRQSKPIIMKHLTFLAITALLTTGMLQAQTTSFGIKAGPQSSHTVWKAESGGDDIHVHFNEVGAHFGFIADIGFNPNFSIQPQLLAVMKGGKGYISDEYNFDIFSLELPINFLYHNNGFFIGGGPSLAYGLSAKLKTEGNPDVDLYDEEILGAGNYKRFEIGSNILMGYRFPSGFTLTGNWSNGWSDIFEESSGSSEDITARTGYFGFSLAYMFSSNSSKKK
jgi:hypothetical protein